MRNRLSRLMILAIASTVLGAVTARSAPVAAAEWMLRAEVNQQVIEGKPIFWSKDRVQLILRDGRFFEFSGGQAKNLRKSSPRFRPYSATEMRSRLFAEYGSAFDVTGTGHYLVVHPAGQKDRWAARFEQLYRDFVYYFSRRGFQLAESEFPLVAVVWPDRAQFFRNAQREGAKIARNTLGYYSPISNRVHLFDADADIANSTWQTTAETIIHEVTHQTAYNTGVHTRFASNPRWVVEGLGTLFEAKGIYNAAQHSSPKDRFNAAQLHAFRSYLAAGRKSTALGEMITSDRFFDANPQIGYAQAWAFSFYLVETQPRRYAEYLQKTAAHKPFQAVSSAERLADFTSVFGDNFALLDARFLRYLAELK